MIKLVLALIIVISLVTIPACGPSAEFELSSLNITPTEIVAGDSLTITANVTNIGEAEGTYTAIFVIDGIQEATKEIKLASGFSDIVSFILTEESPGNHTLGLDGLTGAFRVLRPAEFIVRSLEVMPPEVPAGEKVTATANITNIGEVDGVYSANLTLAGEVVQFKEIPISAGITKSVLFSIIPDRSGTYDIALNGANNTLEVKLSGFEIADRLLESSQDINSYEMDMNFTMDMKMKMEGEVFDASIEMEAELATDIDAEAIKIDMIMLVEATGEESVDISLESYVLGDAQWIKMEAPGEPDEWQMMVMPPDYSDPMLIMDPQFDVLEGSKFNLLGTEVIEGEDCYIMEVIATEETFLQALLDQQQLGQQYNHQPIDFSTMLMSKLYTEFMDISMTQWVTKDTYLLKKVDMSLDLHMSKESLAKFGIPIPEETEDFEIYMAMDIDMIVSNYNLPLLIELPTEAALLVPIFHYKTDYATGGNPWSVAAADFNGDSYNDLAVANTEDATVSVLMNNGNGTFRVKTDYSTGSEPTSVATADFDNDSDFDLAVANTWDDTVSVLLNNGNGTFQEKMDYETDMSPNSIAAADFNSDSYTDLAIANSWGDTVSVLLNNGDGTFQAKADFFTGSEPLAVIAADFDSDFDVDLAVANYWSDTVSILLYDEYFAFKDKTDFPTGFSPVSLFAADLDNDSDFDLATANSWDDTVSVLLNNGDGTFQEKTDYNTDSYPSSVAAADFNNDSYPDLAVANEYSESVIVLLNKGDGTFWRKTGYATGTNPMSLVLADFDGDTYPDLAVVNSESNTISVMLNKLSSIKK
ncbi:MAG TPA: hypothetical protein G4O13_06090 [Dehalococcoidia bacterium]|nr:hypothetical protein [Dehalococcoidia bacterium]